MPVNRIPARPSLVNKPRDRIFAVDLFDQPVQCIEVAFDFAVGSYLAIDPAGSDRNVDGIFVDIQANVNYRLFQGLPPWLWL